VYSATMEIAAARGMSAAVRRRSGVVAVALLGLFGCTRHDVDIEPPAAGRPLSPVERRELQQIADATFRDVRGRVDGLPPRLTVIVRWGKDVIPETGENGAAGFPGNVGWTLDPDRDTLSTIRTQLRPTLVHELHHLARASRVQSRSLIDRVVAEGLATAFERDIAGVDPPWGTAPPEIMAWTREILAQPEASDPEPWMSRHPDGRRWVGMRVGTFLVDRARRSSGKTAADLVFTPSNEIVRLATLGTLQ
jgi:hypothetical protein